MSEINLISDETPQEVKKYNLKIEQLEVGKSGKVGILDVELKQNAELKTVITKQFSQVPFQLLTALFLNYIFLLLGEFHLKSILCHSNLTLFLNYLI